MTAPQNDVGGLTVELAQLGGIDPKSERLIVTGLSVIAEGLTSSFGKDWGMTSHSQGIFMIVLAVLAGVHVLGRNIHHAAVENSNAAVKTALINAAQSTQTPVVVDSPPSVEGVVDPAPANPVTVDNASTTAVGADLPVSDATVPAAPESLVTPPTAAGIPVQ